jgi:hypothetical protein
VPGKDFQFGLWAIVNMEITLQILQTIGICVGAIALTAIAIFAFTLWISFYPVTTLEDEASEPSPDEDIGEEEKPHHGRKRSPRRR